MKILVISDIHAYSTLRKDQSKPSHIHSGAKASECPFSQFADLIKNGSIEQPDLVVCPGDLCDQADSTALNYAWAQLKEIAKQSRLGALICTVGNHDLDSRFSSEQEFDPKGCLIDLVPVFPIMTDPNGECADDFTSRLEFWTENFCIRKIADLCFLVLNSSAFHGYGLDDREINHGRLSNLTFRRIKSKLAQLRGSQQKQRGAPQLNILVCHHHLQKDGDIDDADYSQIKGAHALLDFLASDGDRWFVIHGHRHRARLFSPHGPVAPYVLSSASFGATRDRDYTNTTPNQAHIVNFDFKAMNEYRFYPAGTISTWTFTSGIGWDTRPQEGGLPAKTGFGFRGSLDQIAHQIDGAVQQTAMKWSELTASFPEFRLLDYKQLATLKTLLDDRYDIFTAMNGPEPYEMSKRL